MVADSYTTSRESSVFFLSVIRRTLTQDDFILKMRHLIFISYNVHLTQDVLLRKDKTLHKSSFCLLIMVLYLGRGLWSMSLKLRKFLSQVLPKTINKNH